MPRHLKTRTTVLIAAGGCATLALFTYLYLHRTDPARQELERSLTPQAQPLPPLPASPNLPRDFHELPLVFRTPWPLPTLTLPSPIPSPTPRPSILPVYSISLTEPGELWSEPYPTLPSNPTLPALPGAFAAARTDQLPRVLPLLTAQPPRPLDPTDDPTFAATQLERLHAAPPAYSTTPALRLPLSIPDPLENAQTVRLWPPPEESPPIWLPEFHPATTLPQK